jgi:hypothetical protein
MEALYWYLAAGLFSLGHWLVLCGWLGVDDDEGEWFKFGAILSLTAWPAYWWLAAVVWWRNR